MRPFPTSALVVLLAVTAGARPPDVQRRYDQGKADLDGARYDAAIDQFQQCLDMVAGDPEDTAVMLFALGKTHETRGSDVEALRFYRRLAMGAGDTGVAGKLRQRARGAITKLEGRVMATHGAVDVVTQPEFAVVSIDGHAIGADPALDSPMRLYLPPGRYTVTARMPGYQESSMMVEVRMGADVAVALQLNRQAAVQPPRPAPVVVVKTQPGRSSLGGWLMFAGGLAVAGDGVPFTLGMLENFDDIEALDVRLPPDQGQRQYNDLIADYELNAALQGAFYGVGGALVVVGLALALTADAEDDEPPTTGVRVWPTRRGGLLGVGGTF